jgi:hypothetical protein
MSTAGAVGGEEALWLTWVDGVDIGSGPSERKRLYTIYILSFGHLASLIIEYVYGQLLYKAFHD